MDVSIIIVNYNTCKLTQECINSIYEYTSEISFEVIVVDNASQDGSREFLAKDPRINYLYQTSNLGFGKANNVGLTYATGKYVFFLNSDTYLTCNIIKELCDFARLNSTLNIGALGILLTDEYMVHSPSFGQYYSLKSIVKNMFKRFDRSYDYTRTKLNEIKSKGYASVDYVNGADLFVPTEVLNQVGSFDPIFFMFLEEEDLQRRIGVAGYQRIVLNKKGVVHLKGKSFDGTVSYQRQAMFKKSTFLYVHKYYKHVTFCTIHFLYFMARLKKVLVDYRTFSLKQKIMYLFSN